MTTRRERLERARDRLEESIDLTKDARSLPALVREYRAVLAELDELAGDEPAKGTPLDELAKRRRAARGAGTAHPGDAAADDVRGR